MTKHDGRIELPKGTTANERAKDRVQFRPQIPQPKQTPGPLESYPLFPHCEMCGARDGSHGSTGLEAAFNPSGEAMTLCRDCRIGSAELLADQRTELRAALSGLLFQIDQMKGTFGDEDHTIADAIEDAESALEAIKSIARKKEA